MTTQYPNQIDTNVTLYKVTDNVSPIQAADHNMLQEAIIAIETELGTNPSGSFSTVKSRLDEFDVTFGDLNDILNVLDAKGELLTHTTSAIAALSVGTDGYALLADSSTATGLRWGAVSLTTTTAKGDLLSHNGSATTNLSVGPDGYFLKADSSQSTGLVWAEIPTTGIDGSISANQVAVGSGTDTISGSSALTFTSGSFVVNNGSNATSPLIVQDNGSAVLTVANEGIFTLAPRPITSGNPSVGLTYTGPAISGINPVEVREVTFNFSRLIDVNATGVTVPNQRSFHIQAPFFRFLGSSTITTAATLSIAGAPSAFAGVTITNPYSIIVESGGSQFGNYIDLAEISSPSTPPSGYGRIYPKTDGYIYFKNDSGIEYDLVNKALSGTGGVDQLAYWATNSSIVGSSQFILDHVAPGINVYWSGGTDYGAWLNAGDIESFVDGTIADNVAQVLAGYWNGSVYSISSTMYAYTPAAVGSDGGIARAGSAQLILDGQATSNNAIMSTTATAFSILHGGKEHIKLNSSEVILNNQNQNINLRIKGHALFDGRIATSILPLINDGYDVGSNSLRWRDGYFAAVDIDNGGTPELLQIWRDAGTEVWRIDDGGLLRTNFSGSLSTPNIGASSGTNITIASPTGSRGIFFSGVSSTSTSNGVTITGSQAASAGAVSVLIDTSVSTVADRYPLRVNRSSSTEVFKINGLGQALFQTGSASAPSIAFSNDSGLDTGIYLNGTDNLSITTKGSENLRITSDGYSLIRDGYASTPGLSFIEDQNTGIFRPSADTLALATAGAEVMRLTAGQRIAIGLAVPNYKVHVQGDGYFDGYIFAATDIIAGRQIYQALTTLSYATIVNLDFNTTAFATVNLTGNIEFTTSNIVAGKSCNIRIISDGSTRNFTFPGGWEFIGSPAPASIAANKTALLSLIAFGTTDGSIVAAYSVEP